MSAELAPTEQKPERMDFKLWVEWQGKRVPVVQAPELADLYPKRGASAFEALKLSILANGQEGRCLYVSLDEGETLICVDGRDTSRAIAELRNEGRNLEVAFDVYTPKATTKEKILLELMALVIRRKNLQTAVKLDDESKAAAIVKYLQAAYSQGIHPSDNWVAEDLGCHHSWVTNVRAKAVKELKLIAVTEYQTRNGRTRSITTKRAEVFTAVVTIPIGLGNPANLEDETFDEDLAREQRAQEAAAKAADEILKKS